MSVVLGLEYHLFVTITARLARAITQTRRTEQEVKAKLAAYHA